MRTGLNPNLEAQLEARFSAKVDKSGECWLWTAYRNKTGYGEMGYGNGTRLAHRISYELYSGAIPDGMYVLHRCDNPACVNPAHLFLGTQADNMRDMANKGRNAHGAAHRETMRRAARRGEAHPSAVLTVDQVREIRRDYRVGGVSHAVLAARYGVSCGAIQNVLNGHNWKDVTL